MTSTDTEAWVRPPSGLSNGAGFFHGGLLAITKAQEHQLMIAHGCLMVVCQFFHCWLYFVNCLPFRSFLGQFFFLPISQFAAGSRAANVLHNNSPWKAVLSIELGQWNEIKMCKEQSDIGYIKLICKQPLDKAVRARTFGTLAQVFTRQCAAKSRACDKASGLCGS